MYSPAMVSSDGWTVIMCVNELDGFCRTPRANLGTAQPMYTGIEFIIADVCYLPPYASHAHLGRQPVKGGDISCPPEASENLLPEPCGANCNLENRSSTTESNKGFETEHHCCGLLCEPHPSAGDGYPVLWVCHTLASLLLFVER